MTSKPTPKTPQPPETRLKQLAFAFPFLRKAQDSSGANAQFIDEHEIYQLLAASEPSGSYLVSRKGMWHGGIHVTEAGAGQAMDLDAGLRCIADGVLIAYRANKDYPVSEPDANGSNTLFHAPYSTGFALVRHEMEFPRGTKLTFYSLYMHLMSNTDYDSNFPKRQKPGYWSRQWQITEHAQDKQRPGPGGQTAASALVGLHVRKTPNGSALGMLPQGANVTIGKTQKVHGATWGQVTNLNGATLYALEAGGYVAADVAINGWIYMGAQNGGPVAKESIPDSMFDRIIVTTNRTCSPVDPQGTDGGMPVKAGDLMGHLGRYDPLDRCSAGARMAHVEVFCGESIKEFVSAGRAWVNSNGANAPRWSQLGLPADPTILRVDRGTTLYHDHGRQGQDAKQIDIVQVETFAALQRDANRQFLESAAGNDGAKRHWWKVDGADKQRNAISGWVREQSFAGGRVTREFAQSWIDFECHDKDHDPTHTIFATTSDYVDYALGSDVPGAGSISKLSPLMTGIYRVLYPTGDGLHAANDLCCSSEYAQGAGFPWITFRASRLIAKHESEWANPAKWQELVNAIEQRTGPKPEHEEEKKRIAKLVWWDEVAAGVAGFPGADVYHINPIALVGNFILSFTCAARFEKISKIVLHNEGGFVNDPDDSGGATNKGIAWPAWQAYAKEDIGVEPTLENLKALTDEQAKIIYLKRYWEPRGFCGFSHEKTALNIYDWTITSGKAIRKIQELLASDYSLPVAINNNISKELIDQINSIDDQEELAQKIGAARKEYYTSISYDKDGSPSRNHKFLNGWIKRVDRCLDYMG